MSDVSIWLIAVAATVAVAVLLVLLAARRKTAVGPHSDGLEQIQRSLVMIENGQARLEAALRDGFDQGREQASGKDVSYVTR